MSNDDCAPAAPYCDAYAGHICTVGLTFATGALDCHGYEATGADAGVDSGAGLDADAASTPGPNAGDAGDAGDATGE
jgi:hypothetical protein